ncbi:hypothetical protein BT63DRAFT_425834 [Microthyrium microscopicum]|uniref:Uncharacterized protein n=1 Tax=Microthyrium microscopicum TaxID=703497 RepID=A0A6A6UAA2_9PEZI|nr:hypothetical protein BT63DRAFT_425834 [Microthyrium microscopicum]
MATPSNHTGDFRAGYLRLRASKWQYDATLEYKLPVINQLVSIKSRQGAEPSRAAMHASNHQILRAMNHNRKSLISALPAEVTRRITRELFQKPKERLPLYRPGRTPETIQTLQNQHQEVRSRRRRLRLVRMIWKAAGKEPSEASKSGEYQTTAQDLLRTDATVFYKMGYDYLYQESTFHLDIHEGGVSFLNHLVVPNMARAEAVGSSNIFTPNAGPFQFHSIRSLTINIFSPTTAPETGATKQVIRRMFTNLSNIVDRLNASEAALSILSINFTTVDAESTNCWISQEPGAEAHPRPSFETPLSYIQLLTIPLLRLHTVEKASFTAPTMLAGHPEIGTLQAIVANLAGKEGVDRQYLIEGLLMERFAKLDYRDSVASASAEIADLESTKVEFGDMEMFVTNEPQLELEGEGGEGDMSWASEDGASSDWMDELLT